MAEFYDGTKLLSLKDINGKTPEIYICTSNRTGGKTTYFNRLLVNRFLKGKGKFILLYRNVNELYAIHDKFFKDIKELFFPEYYMISKPLIKEKIIELFIGKEKDKEPPVSCGYAIALYSAPKLKQYSHLLSDAGCMLFDEFQPEQNDYLPHEIDNFLSLHTSIARGAGKQVRYLPVYMVANAVSLINPYYTALGIGDRLTKDTHFLKGDGFVMETTYIDSAAKALKESGIGRAFSHSKYMKYASENVYLNDNEAFIGKPSGRGHYLATLQFEGELYAVLDYPTEGYVYCSDSVDTTFPTKIAVTVQDHGESWTLIEHSSVFVQRLRYLFEQGACRFKNLKCKRALMSFISY